MGQKKKTKLSILTRLDNIEERLDKISEKAVLTSEEAADFLGITVKSLYDLTSKHQIPYYKPNGKKTYFERAELETWLHRNRVASKHESK